MKDCTTCKYGYEDERLGIPMCHHPKRFSEDCVNFNMYEEKEIKESEKPINLDDAMKELNEKIALVKRRGTWDGVDVDKYMDEVRGREPEKPMNLEEEINRTYHDGSVTDTSDIDHVTYENIARHFYDLGCRRTAEKYDEIEYNRQRAEESVPNDLEEAGKTLYPYKEGYDVDLPYPSTYDENEEQRKAFIAGAKWQKQHDAELIEIAYNDGITIGMTKQKEQMMKEAVEGVVRKDGTIGYFEFSNEQQFHSLLEKFQDCDKVRIIIVKEDGK